MDRQRRVERLVESGVDPDIARTVLIVIDRDTGEAQVYRLRGGT